MDFPLSVLQQVKQWDLPAAVTPTAKTKNTKVSSKRINVPSKENTVVNLSEESKEKIKSLANNKPATSIEVKGDIKPAKRKVVQTPTKREKRPPAPIKWRSRNINNDAGHIKYWAYKRNYMACYVDCNGANYPYEIWEISDKTKHKLVLKVECCTDNDGLVEQLENIIRTLAKGYDITLTEYQVEHGKFIKENIKFVPYEETDQPVKLSPEEERIKNAQEEERLMKILAERRSKANAVDKV